MRSKILKIIILTILFIQIFSIKTFATSTEEEMINSQKETFGINSFIENANKYTGEFFEGIDINSMLNSAIKGKIDNKTIYKKIINLLPEKFDISKTLIVGLRSWDKGMKERQEELKIKSLSPDEVRNNSSAILEWLKNTGVSKVVIHFDLDVLDPAEIIAGVGVEANGMKIKEVIRIINDIASKHDLVGLTIAEPMPRIAIKLKNMMNELPLLK